MLLKRFLLCLMAITWCSVCIAQAPAAMTFQAVVRTAQGAIAADRNITVQATIVQGSANGTTVYSENFSGKTNANGLVTLKIGGGTPTVGNFATIDWTDGPYFLTIAVDPDGGFSFTTQSTTQLLSVPYALHANTATALTEPVSYNDLVDVPANAGGGFSGNYNDLTGKPELATVATTGEYSDLQGAPTLADVATSGNYTDLQGTPALATVATSGKYDDLQGKPTLATVSATGNYSDLQGAPALAAVATSGSYNDLKDKPNLSASGSFSGSYNDLTNKPNLQDSIAKYASGSSSKPAWNDISGKPQGSNEGDILYWSEAQWKTLPVGEEGQFLAIADGQLSWVDPDWANTTATTYKVGDIYFNAAGEAEGVVCELSTVGRYAKIIGLNDYTSVQWDPLAVDGCWDESYTGTLPTETKSTNQNNGLTNMTTIKNISGWETAYPAFKTCADAGDSWYLPSRKEMLNIAANVDAINTQLSSIPGATAISQSVYWTSTEGGRDFAYAVTTKDYTFTSDSETITIAKDNAFDDAKAKAYGVRPMRRLSWAETTSKNDNQTSYKPGDLYIVSGDTLGIVYTTHTGGIHGYAITFAEYNLAWCTVATDSIDAKSMDNGSANTQKMAEQANPSQYPLLQQAQAIGTGWYIPSADEWVGLQAKLTDINAYITNQRPTATLLNTSGIYWSSTEENKANAYTVNMGTGNTASTAKTEQKSIRYIIAF